jgi:hypothetical protein
MLYSGRSASLKILYVRIALHDSLCVLLAIYRLPKHDPQYLVGQLCHTAGRLSNEGGSNGEIIRQFHGAKARVKRFG